MKIITSLLALSTLVPLSLLAQDGTFFGDYNRRWQAGQFTGAWVNGIVADGAGNTLTIDRTIWTATHTLSRLVAQGGDVIIGNIAFDGTAAGGFGATLGGDATITLDNNGSASLVSNAGGGFARLYNAIILANDLNLKNEATIDTYLTINSLITNSNDATMRTITTLPSATPGATARAQRIVFGNAIDGNIALVHNSGNDLYLQNNVGADGGNYNYYGGLYIQSGTVVSSTIGARALGTQSNKVTFRQGAVGAPVGILSFNETITQASDAIVRNDIVLESDGRVSVSIATSGENNHIRVEGLISGAGALYKLGSGKLVLVNQNTYTGNTIVENGTLALGINNAINTATHLVLNGGTFDAATYNQSMLSLTLTANSNITLDEGAFLIFGDSSGIDWGAYSLTVIGTFIDGVSIRFGSDENSLTAAQLAQITINGQQANIDANGFLIAVPEPSVAALLLGGIVLVFATARRRR